MDKTMDKTMDKKEAKAWLYKDGKGMIFSGDQIEKAKKQGWSDSVNEVKYARNDIVLDDTDENVVEDTDRSNDIVLPMGFEDWGKDELEAYAKENFDEDLDKRKSVEFLRQRVVELIEKQ